MVLHKGGIAEMRTGEGKTLVATLPVYLNALEGKGVHVVTVNDYLAKRDADWMGQVYRFLGSRSAIVHGLDDASAARLCLRHHLRHQQRIRLRLSARQHEVLARRDGAARPPLRDRRRGRQHPDRRSAHAADHLRPDRGPLGTLQDDRRAHPRCSPEHYELDEKQRSVFTESGNEKIEDLLQAGILKGDALRPANITIVHHVNQALRAHKLFQRTRTTSSRTARCADRRIHRPHDEGPPLSEGLHQAIEAKEGVKIQPENQTLASITFQNYFRLYDKLAGMTGTAATEAEEFMRHLQAGVVEIPTNRPVSARTTTTRSTAPRARNTRRSSPSSAIKRMRTQGPAVLVGTTSIEKSEAVSNLLSKAASRTRC
jgi:preprotein translocase subunit SecA